EVAPRRLRLQEPQQRLLAHELRRAGVVLEGHQPLGAVPADVDDVGLVLEEEPRQVGETHGPLVAELDAVGDAESGEPVDDPLHLVLQEERRLIARARPQQQDLELRVPHVPFSVKTTLYRMSRRRGSLVTSPWSDDGRPCTLDPTWLCET